MENEIKLENKEEKSEKKELKKLKSRKSVNWDSKTENEEKQEKEKVNISNINSKELLEIEVINKDGNVEKEYVKYEHRPSKEFNQKREENSHNEYTKAKEFLESHKNDEE